MNRSGRPVFALAGEDDGFSPVRRLLGAFETGLYGAVRLGSPHLFRVPVVASADPKTLKYNKTILLQPGLDPDSAPASFQVAWDK